LTVGGFEYKVGPTKVGTKVEKSWV